MPVFSFRSECPHDINRFAETLTAKQIEFNLDAKSDPLDVEPEPRWMGECVAELVVDKSLDELRKLMKEQDDAHVMIETLREVPLAQNSLERDRTVDC